MCSVASSDDVWAFSVLQLVSRYQRGHGLGSIFESLFKSAVPLLKRGAKNLGREALKTGLNLASDVMERQNVIQATKSRLKSTGQKLTPESYGHREQ
jgi:hypothetical protein